MLIFNIIKLSGIAAMSKGLEDSDALKARYLVPDNVC